MKLHGLLEAGEGVPALDELVSDLLIGTPPPTPLGVYHAARPYVVALMAQRLDLPLLVLTARGDRARQWVDELRTWLPDEVPVHFFADPDALPYERIPWVPETRQRRLESLVGLLSWDGRGRDMAVNRDAVPATASPRQRAPLVVSSARALMQRTLPAREMRAALRPIRAGQAFDLGRILASWVGLGYESTAVVENPGQFSRRGGIIDIWPPNLRSPIRIELFGDEVDSLRIFDPSTQRTLAHIPQSWIGPASEGLPKLGERIASRLAELDLSPCHPPARIEYEREIESLMAGSGVRNLEWYIPYLYSQPGSLLDYPPAETGGQGPTGLVLLDDAAEIMSSLSDLEGQAIQLARDLSTAGDVPANLLPPYFSAGTLRSAIENRPHLMLDNSTLDGWSEAEAGSLGRAFSAGSRYGGQLRPLLAELERELDTGHRIVLVSRQAPRLANLLEESGHAITPTEGVPEPPGSGITLVQGVMDEGWLLNRGTAATEFWLLTDAELFGWNKPRPRRPQRPSAVGPEVFFADVRPGDYVVHMEHGIGQFKGLVKLTLDEIEREYLRVDYAQDDQLYVPVHQADRLARYVGAGEANPSMHRLGTTEWEQVKARARRAVAEIADDLLQLYASREVVQGHAFGADAPWQAELEASFPYIETEDQLVAIEAVKHDMEQTRPMDRLICGDVGYGKTEVALRAAFKAIMDGKQVAILVPTTVLAQQHYTNFSRRLAPFPVSVAMLSRFQTPAQQDRALSGLTNGSIDLVIGTHRLLSRDVSLKDLGLLIVDEEQRFGVVHKERIKQMRTEVDVLTLTATPIPRTLHMSLTGVRDLSTIETPPEERLPIKTFVGEFDESLIRQAILRELDRNGQIYFVHNRVQGIQQMAARVRKMVPEARIVIGHGQMPERELSSVMLAFAEGDYDVLVCTSIIESGLDIPNVNTIIINRADQFGLAQLYQLRGRVGRSAVRAYSYLLVDKYKTLTSDARRRLEAIQEASELGAGFRIAMHDLEIRGAGELLGSRQHGHIAAVGFDLYNRLLAQAVQEARQHLQSGGQSSKEAQDRNPLEDPLAPTVTLDLHLPARIPETYVAEGNLRLQLYRRLAGVTTLQAVDEIRQEFADRFGPLPEEIENLLFVVRVKVLAVRAGIEAIGHEEGQLLIKSARLDMADRPEDSEITRVREVTARVARRGIWLDIGDSERWREHLVKTLESLGEAIGD